MFGSEFYIWLVFINWLGLILLGRKSIECENMLSFDLVSCELYRFDATKLLESIRGKRLVFVGDSINRNQWESMLCLLMSVVRDPKKVYETHGRRITKEKGNYSFKFVVLCKCVAYILDICTYHLLGLIWLVIEEFNFSLVCAGLQVYS